jgi:RNA polymerase sigma-B factor
MTANLASIHPRRASACATLGTSVETVEELLRRRAGLPRDDPRRASMRVRSIEAGLPMARRLATRYRGHGEPLDDLYQVAALALVKAVDGYDPARQVAFTSYAAPTIVGALKRHFRDSTWRLRVPRRHKEMAVRIGPVRAALTHQLGRSPSIIELAAHLDATEGEVAVALSARRCRCPESLDASSAADGAWGQSLIETIGGVDPGFGATINWNLLRPLLAALPDRERRIVVMRYYADLTQAEISVRLGLSQVRISRLLVRTLRQLRVQILAERPSGPSQASGQPQVGTADPGIRIRIRTGVG